MNHSESEWLNNKVTWEDVLTDIAKASKPHPSPHPTKQEAQAFWNSVRANRRQPRRTRRRTWKDKRA